jgi:hypothetical protein
MPLSSDPVAVPRKLYYYPFLSSDFVGQVGNLQRIVNPPAGSEYNAGEWPEKFAACRYVGQPILAVLMGLRPTNRDENLPGAFLCFQWFALDFRPCRRLSAGAWLRYKDLYAARRAAWKGGCRQDCLPHY